ncbi:MAG: glycosyltransferase family 2 protein [Pyrinomonadaceae bacterium]|nr:glycosyltransferase family 2 protein [Pyrinomonadaceae bacterium]
MPLKNPYFSVVMPTYNRAQFLPLAIKSVLKQTFDDFELIVSNGGSTDNTKNVVADFNDPRIRYIESKVKLDIGDNYQIALNEAKGEYITFLGDDDAFISTMLDRVYQIIKSSKAEIVSFKFCNYYQEDYVETDGTTISPNSLFIPSHTGELNEFNAKRAMELLYNVHGLNKANWARKFSFPVLANAVYHHEIFSRIKRIKEHLFASTPADMYLASAVFYVVDSYFCLDEPMLVWTRWSGNSTASPQKKGNGLRRHYENLLNGNTLKATPLKFALPLNCSINAILQAKEDFKDESRVDWVLYFKAIHFDLMSLREIGVNVTREFEEFESVLASYSPEFQTEVRREILDYSGTLKQRLKTKLPSVVNFLRRISKFRSTHDSKIISGCNVGFNNVLEAAGYINQHKTNNHES